MLKLTKLTFTKHEFIYYTELIFHVKLYFRIYFHLKYLISILIFFK